MCDVLLQVNIGVGFVMAKVFKKLGRISKYSF
jgi:hypothetical protein